MPTPLFIRISAVPKGMNGEKHGRKNSGIVLWFLEGNRFGIEEELYQNMSSNLLEVLKDILEALEQEDMVLLHDAAANGLLEYLQLFVNTEQEDGANDNI